MKKEIILRLSPEDAANEILIKSLTAHQLGLSVKEISEIQIIRRSIDARRRPVTIELNIEAYTEKNEHNHKSHFEPTYKNVISAPEIIVIGAGPGGLFAALRLIELGLKPIILERGKEISERKKDLALLNRNNPVNPESNYAFGEGGAGAFSDGKLNTRSKKRGNLKRILEILHYFGADENILIDSQPHIGSDHLPEIIKKIRQSIIDSGGEIRFNTRIDDLIIENDIIKGVISADGEKFFGKATILATGHSAKDIYEILHRKGVIIEAKPFAMGVRVEHPQNLIDKIQYHSPEGRGNFLPPATYSFTGQVRDRGVYSFCVCPGGIIVPSMTNSDEMVVNGMSSSKRNSPFANSGMVVEIRLEDIPNFEEYGVLAGLMYQKELERNCFKNAGKHIVAPAQRLTDFVSGRLSYDLPECSYLPGIISAPLHFILPLEISGRLRDAFKLFGKQAKGYLTADAVVTGLESRTSSPVRIPRDSQTLQHVQIKGLYPCGEGSGYAGGITSSAIDGERCAEMVAIGEG